MVEIVALLPIGFFELDNRLDVLLEVDQEGLEAFLVWFLADGSSVDEAANVSKELLKELRL